MNYIKRTGLVLFIIWMLGILTLEAQQKEFARWTDCPPMGWNSYNSYGSAVQEEEVKANAMYMAMKLKQHGWQYVVVDYLWSYDTPPGNKMGNTNQKNLDDGSFIPWLAMDKWARLLPHVNKFPSAFGGNGFKPLADYVHKKGLKFGIHVMRGIPRQAVWAKTPVQGTNGVTADQIADVKSTCEWMNHMYGLKMSAPGAQEYLNSVLNLYASWGVDFIKVDDISRPFHASEIEGYRKAIDQCGRKIVLSLSPGETPIIQAEAVLKNANMWRISEDFWDSWKEVKAMFALGKRWEGIGGNGQWPDCDMLQIGRLSKRGPNGPERFTNLTADESRTHLTFWSIYRSPLILGGNLPESREADLRLLTNDEVIMVNQHGRAPKQLYRNDKAVVWYSRAADAKGVYLACFNIDDLPDPRKIAVELKALGFAGKCRVRDLWAHKDLGEFTESFNPLINKHGAGLYKIESATK